MTEYLLADLERILKANEFTILDTSTIVADHDCEIKKYLRRLTLDQHIDLSQTPIGRAITHHQLLCQLLNSSVAMVTKEVFEEFERGNKCQERIIDELIINPRDTNKKPQKINSANGIKTLLGEEVKKTTDKTEEALKQRQIFFLKPDLYKILFQFSKDIMPYTRTEVKLERERTKPKTQDYLFADESITAAVIYFTITGENRCPTVIVSRDHDIKRELRLAHNLFIAASPDRFRTRAERTPFKGYFWSGDNKVGYYLRLHSARKSDSMGSLELDKKSLGEEKVKELVVYAGETLDKVFSI